MNFNKYLEIMENVNFSNNTIFIPRKIEKRNETRRDAEYTQIMQNVDEKGVYTSPHTMPFTTPELKIQYLFELPKNIKVINCGLNLYGNIFFRQLPDNLTINGYLKLTHTKLITQLPKNLTVNGPLYLEYSSITNIPKDLNCKKFIVGVYSQVSKIEKTHFNNVVNFAHCKNLTQLPDNMVIEVSNGVFSNTGISDFPKNLKIKQGNLDIKNTPLASKIIKNVLTVGKYKTIKQYMQKNHPDVYVSSGYIIFY